VLDLFVLRLLLLLLKFVLLILDSFKIVEVTLIVVELLVEEVDDLLNCGIKEVTSVRDDDDSDLQLLHVVLQPDESIEIQMVGGLIQEQDLGLTEDDFGDSDTHAPSTGELFGWDREVALTEA